MPIGPGSLSRRLDALPRAGMAAVLLSVFVAVHAVAYAVLGIGFDVHMMSGSWQLLDPTELRYDLLRSLYYLHCQPPAWNLLVGVVSKIQPDNGGVYHVLFVAAAAGLYASMFGLLRALGVRRALALLVASVFLASPSSLLYEHWCFYTFPIAAALAITALALHRFVQTGSRAAVVIAFALLGLICATWSAFHLVYFLAVAGGALVLAPEHRGVVLRAAVVPGVLLAAVYLKNGIVFGSFAASSWTGMGLARATLPFIPRAELEALAREGRVSPVALVPPYSPLAEYPAEYQDPGRFGSVPVLARLLKHNKYGNFNHIGYLALSRQYRRDVTQALRSHPGALLAGVKSSFAIYARPASDYRHLSPNRARIPRYEAWFDRLVYPRTGDAEQPFYPSLALGLPALFAFGMIRARRSEGRAERGLLLFMLGTIVYATLVFNVLENGENNRFRFVLDPFFVVLLGVALEGALRRMRHGLGGRSG